MALPLTFVVEGPPVSQRASNQSRARWRQKVSLAAQSEWSSGPAVEEAVAVTLICLIADRDIDVDNVPKPILDALSELVYQDDVQVTDLVVRKRRLSEVRFERDPPPKLVRYIGTGRPVVHVSVDTVQTEETLS